MSPLIDGAHTRPRMARPKRDEDPDELALLVTREFHDHAERPLRRSALTERQIDLRATSKASAIGPMGLTRTRICQRQAVELEALPGAAGDLKRPTSKPSYRLVPDTLIKPDGQATTAGGARHASAFAVRRPQLAHERREVLVASGRRAEPRVHDIPRFGRRDLQQLRRQALHALGDPLGLLHTQRSDRRHRPLDVLKLLLKLAYGVLGRHVLTVAVVDDVITPHVRGRIRAPPGRG